MLGGYWYEKTLFLTLKGHQINPLQNTIKEQENVITVNRREFASDSSQ